MRNPTEDFGIKLYPYQKLLLFAIGVMNKSPHSILRYRR